MSLITESTTERRTRLHASTVKCPRGKLNTALHVFGIPAWCVLSELCLNRTLSRWYFDGCSPYIHQNNYRCDNPLILNTIYSTFYSHIEAEFHTYKEQLLYIRDISSNRRDNPVKIFPFGSRHQNRGYCNDVKRRTKQDWPQPKVRRDKRSELLFLNPGWGDRLPDRSAV
jgi:hypothetical protein